MLDCYIGTSFDLLTRNNLITHWLLAWFEFEFLMKSRYDKLDKPIDADDQTEFRLMLNK